jgi:hypothetical protein
MASTPEAHRGDQPAGAATGLPLDAPSQVLGGMVLAGGALRGELSRNGDSLHNGTTPADEISLADYEDSPRRPARSNRPGREPFRQATFSDSRGHRAGPTAEPVVTERVGAWDGPAPRSGTTVAAARLARNALVEEPPVVEPPCTYDVLVGLPLLQPVDPRGCSSPSLRARCRGPSGGHPRRARGHERSRPAMERQSPAYGDKHVSAVRWNAVDAASFAHAYVDAITPLPEPSSGDDRATASAQPRLCVIVRV